LVALFSGARQAEIAGLKASNVQQDITTDNVPLLFTVAERKSGKRVKTRVSERVVPVHPELIRMGFLKYVAHRSNEDKDAWSFPLVAPDKHRALAAWSKWFGQQYLRKKVGISDTDKVFHSFRHCFQDALRAVTPDEELRDALAGRSGQKSVSRDYGAKNMLRRWGVERLKETIDKISYPGLDLSRVQPTGIQKRSRGGK
jgi:integrase